jgi:hypothetical protein
MAGYHQVEIPRGKFGEISKIGEEFLELKDAVDQNNRIMALLELSDLIGAIEGFVEHEFNNTVSFDDLLKMKDATHRAFKEGKRKSD